MIKVVDFKPEHLVNIKKEDIDAEVLTFLGDIDERAIQYSQAGPAITLIEESEHFAVSDEILAIGGCIHFWRGVGEAWMMVAPEGRIKKVALYKTMGEFVDKCFREYGFHRLQTTILFDHQEAHKCIMRMGFVPEGMMIHYGPRKENYIRYVKLAGA
jgi:hypothetical protein